VILHYDGYIFDFDYLNVPSVERISDYFERMFLDEVRQPRSGGFYVGREEKLTHYRIKAITGQNYFERREGTHEERERAKVSFRQWIDSHR
jgi:hypothetical protein